MKNTMITMLLLCISVTSVRAELIREEVEYKAGDTVLKGYIVKNSGCTGKVGAVLVVPEWWGLNAYARRRADMLADLGYVAMAVDMYGDGKLADRPDEASRLSTAIRKNREMEKERFLAALNVLREQPCVDPSKIAAIGYCFGGGVVLEMAREGVDLKGVASFHGRLTTEKPAEPGKVKAKILVLNGAEDQLTTPQDIAAFR